MTNRYEQYISRERKCKIIVTILWLFLALMSTVELLDYIIYQIVDYTLFVDNFFVDHILVSLGISTAITVLTTLLYKYFNLRNTLLTSYIVMFGFLTFIHAVIVVHYNIHVIYMSYALVIFISILFTDKVLTTCIAGTSLILYIHFCAFYLGTKPANSYHHNFMDMAATFVFISGCYMASIFMMKFFNELIVKITDASLLTTHLEKKIQLDSFTNLYNRASFDDTLDLSFQRFHSDKTQFTTLMMDIDNFKRINDTYGHSYGDEVILELVRVINECKPENDKAFRYGGEEFTLILNASEKDGFLVAEKIRTTFCASRLERMKDELFSVSIGLCECNENHKSVEQYFIDVDLALYKAKHSGKNQSVIATVQNTK